MYMKHIFSISRFKVYTKVTNQRLKPNIINMDDRIITNPF